MCWKVKAGRKIFDEARNVMRIANDDKDRLVIFPALELFDFPDSIAIKGIGTEAIKSVGTKSDHATARNYGDNLTQGLIGLTKYHRATRSLPLPILTHCLCDLHAKA